MIRAVLTALLFLQTAGAPACEDDLVLKWNAFANFANEYIHTRDASPERRQRGKAKLARLWENVNSCPCF